MLFFFLFQYFEETEYQTESKWNETFANVIFAPNVIRRLGPYSKKFPGRSRGWRAPPLGAPLPRGALDAPPTYSFLLYIPTYPRTIKTGAKNLIPPPQPSVSTRSHRGACSGAPPEEASTTEGFYIITIAPTMKCE